MRVWNYIKNIKTSKLVWAGMALPLFLFVASLEGEAQIAGMIYLCIFAFPLSCVLVFPIGYALVFFPDPLVHLVFSLAMISVSSLQWHIIVPRIQKIVDRKQEGM